MIKRLAKRELKTKFGSFTEILYYDGQKESIAIVVSDTRVLKVSQIAYGKQ